MHNRSLFFKQIKLELCYEKIGLGFVSLSYDDREAGFDSLLLIFFSKSCFRLRSFLIPNLLNLLV
jgi:hypothetical protein